MNQQMKILIAFGALLAIAVPIFYPPSSRQAVDYYHISACVTSTELTVTADDIQVQILTPLPSPGMIQTWHQEDISGVLNMTINGTYTFRLRQPVARVRFIIDNETHWTSWYELMNWQKLMVLAFGVDYSYVLEAWVEYNHSGYEWVYFPLTALEDRRQSRN